MPRYLSPEWVRAFNAALAELDLTDAIAAAGTGSVTAASGTFTVAQVITDDAAASVRTVPASTSPAITTTALLGA